MGHRRRTARYGRDIRFFEYLRAMGFEATPKPGETIKHQKERLLRDYPAERIAWETLERITDKESDYAPK